MCGRYTLTNPARLAQRFGASQGQLNLEVRYNVAPSQEMPVVLQDQTGSNKLELLKWGLIPFWSKEPKAPYSTINARAEGIADKPAYRRPLRSQRCIIPADGFYEWLKTNGGKQPFFIHLKDEDVFGFAGLYDIYHTSEKEIIKTFTIITTEANEIMAPIHNRMPVILPRQHEAEWLDRTITDPVQITRLLQPFPSEWMELFPVSNLVNKPANDTPELLKTLNSA